jgi:hypothetical protein
MLGETYGMGQWRKHGFMSGINIFVMAVPVSMTIRAAGFLMLRVSSIKNSSLKGILWTKKCALKFFIV